MFMHGGWLHLGGNMLYLWIFGDNVEDRLGHATFTIFYFLCGIAATFAQLMVSPGSNVPNLGASGAIAGVLGSYILLFPQGRVRVLQGQQVVQMPALMVIGFWIVLQLFSGIGSISSAAEAGGVAYMAHVGGFVRGVCADAGVGRQTTRRHGLSRFRLSFLPEVAGAATDVVVGGRRDRDCGDRVRCCRAGA
jgi:membrane associated rhomboid family serine protease